MAVLLVPPFIQFFDDLGNPLAGGKVRSYAAGTTAPKATYTSAEGDIQNPNPVILDSAGRAVIFIQGSYRFDIFDSEDVLIRSIDDITSYATLESSNQGFFNLFSGDGTTTSFTLSENLGTDAASLLVFVSKPTQSFVTNGSFATDTDWTKGAGWTIAAGVATAAGAISTALSQTAPATIVDGKAYRLTYTVTRSAGGIIPSIGGRGGTERTASGTYTEIIIGGSSQTIAFTGNAFTGTVDDVVITDLDLLGFEIQPPTAFILNGTTLTFAVAPPNGTSNIYVFAPTKLIGAASAAADAAIAAAAAAEAAVITVQNQKVVWQGDWVAGTYQINDAVQYLGSSWIATAVTTDTPSLASADWDLLANKGVDGTGGVASPTSGQTGYLLRASGAGTYGWFGGNTAIAAAGTMNLAATTSNTVNFTGTGGPITSLGVPTASGDIRYVRHTNVHTLTHDGVLIFLPGGANITTAINDVSLWVSVGGTGWRCFSYVKSSGKAVIGPSSTDITDSTVAGRALLVAADVAAQRSALTLTGAATATFASGTWTPVLEGTTTAGVGTYTANRYGNYLRIGNMVIFNGRIDWTAHTGTGNTRITGLPVNPANASVCDIKAINLTLAANNYVFGNFAPSTGAINVVQTSLGTVGAWSNVAIDTAGDIIFSGIYNV